MSNTSLYFCVRSPPPPPTHPNNATVKVTINAVENSASVASLVLTTECLIAEIPVEVSEAQQQANYDAMGGGDYM